MTNGTIYNILDNPTEPESAPLGLFTLLSRTGPVSRASRAAHQPAGSLSTRLFFWSVT